MRLRYRLLIERLLMLVVVIALVSVIVFRDYQSERTSDIAEEYTVIADKVIPAVVAITAGDNASASYGSGVIMSPDGFIVTNNHVISNASLIKVIVGHKDIYAATIVGIDAPTDIAVIKINASGLPIVLFGNSDEVKVGEHVVAIGNPFGLESTITSGIVSAKNRDRGPTVYRNFIQTDAAINPGNSGGPLVNVKGEVIGINTFIYTNYVDPNDDSRTLTSRGLGFALPSNEVKLVADALISNKPIRRGFLGVKVMDVSTFNESLGKGEIVAGANVSGLFDDSPALAAGVKPGDFIIALNGQVVESSNQLKNTIGLMFPGDEVILMVLRDVAGKKVEKNFKIVLAERPVDIN
ncbi:MAG: trypsin-like peptidase domain-containing protein [Nanoarchaeota archaeon]|nr:trypsin-like peptidase domain-containing protein [Nanoarchaeota archaeon]